MKKFILNLSAFAVFAAVFYVLLVLCSGQLAPKKLRGNIIPENKIQARDFSNRRFNEIPTNTNVDYMILGTSHAYRSYDPRIFAKAGFSSYNLGSSSQPLGVTRSIYEKYVKQLQPKNIILDIYPIFLNRDATEGTINMLPLFYNDPDFVWDALQIHHPIILNNLIYFNFFGNPNAVKAQESEKDTYVSGGFVQRTERLKVIPDRFETSKTTVDPVQVQHIKDIIADAKKRGINVYLFQAPIPKARFESIQNTPEIDRLLHSLGNYHNFNAEKHLPNQYFFDDSHINQGGVEIYDPWVINILKKETAAKK